MKNSVKENPNVYTSLSGLISLQYQARGFFSPPFHYRGSPLYGRYRSRLRGRGLNLEELRQYYPGDDIRLMDWKTTIRTGRPHVRSYTEDRDHPVLLLVDQRISMFFGSRVKMKSVVAAELAALSAWGVLFAGDRVGALVYNDHEIVDIKPHRSRKTLLQLLGNISAFNRRLKIHQKTPQNDKQFGRVLSKAEQLVTHDFLVLIISDLSGMDSDAIKHIKRMARHNDVTVLYIYDSLEKSLPREGKFVISDGELQIEVDPGEKDVGQRFKDHFTSHVTYLEGQLNKFGIPVILIHTGEEPKDQISRIMGQRRGKR